MEENEITEIRDILVKSLCVKVAAISLLINRHLYIGVTVIHNWLTVSAGFPLVCQHRYPPEGKLIDCVRHMDKASCALSRTLASQYIFRFIPEKAR